MDELNLTIDRLTLTFTGAAGHEHRVRAIGARAAALLRELVGQQLVAAGVDVADTSLGDVQAGPVQLDLAHSTDEAVARMVAAALYEALLLQLRVAG